MLIEAGFIECELVKNTGYNSSPITEGVLFRAKKPKKEEVNQTLLKEAKMGFWDLKSLKLNEFRPGILSKVESGKNLTMACMEIVPNKEGTAHDHPFDQCGIVIEGEIEMSIGEEKRLLRAMETYFISAGIKHNWKTISLPAKILDIIAKE